MRTLRLAAALAAALLLVPPASAKEDDADPAAREWSQARGGSTRSGSSGVEPLRSDPVEAWKRALPGPLVAEPVTWGGVVFVAAQKDKARKLLAFRAATGEPLGEKDLGAGGRVGLATWQGVVIVAEAGQIRTFPHQGTKFGSGWASRGTFSAPPCVYRGYVFACDGGELVALDVMRGGSKVARTPVASPTGLAGFNETKDLKVAPVGGAVGVYRNRADGVVYAINVATVDTVVLLSRTRVDDLTTKPQLRYTTTWMLGTFPGAVPETDRWDMVPARIEGDDAKGMGAWVVLSPRPFTGGATGKFVPDDADARGLDLATPLAVVGGVAYSFNKSGDLKSWRVDGKTDTVIASDKAPPGSKPGPATRAGGVVFLGNFAFDPGEGRTIWTLKTPPATPIVPVGDRRLVYATETELVCVADTAAAPEPAAAPAAASGGAGANTDAAAPTGAAPPRLPGDEDGVVLDDGRQFDGTFDRSPTMLTIHAKDGSAELEVPLTQVVVAQKGGEVEVRGDDTGACKVWRAAVRGAYCDALQAIFQEYAKASMVDDARRVEQRMRDAGASEARLQKLDATLNGKVPRADAAKSKKLVAQEDAARTAAIEGYLRGVEWCGKREFRAAGTVLIADVAKIKGAADPDLAARAKALVPEGFPWKSAPDAAQQWAEWADALLPSGATFLTGDDDAWGRLTNEPWKSERPLGFRTRNILLFCMDRDPAVCGKSLFLAEGTVRSLQVLLNAGAVEPVSGDQQRIEVRIHKNRKAYLEEQSATGQKAMEWSGGYFSPRENISRFYVDRGEREPGEKDRERGTSDRGTGGGGSAGGPGSRGTPDMKELGRVLTHELTHHYMEMRWMGNRGGGGGAGYWVIEGMATFVENQAVQMDRRGFAFDDRTVEDLDALSTIEGQGSGLFKAERFVDMDHGDFDKLNNTPFIRVKLRSSTGEKYFSERALWYAQAGALSFFFLHQKGAEGRERFVSYVRQHYMGSAPRPGWAALGYDSAEDLDKEFFGFLKKLRGG